MRVEEQYEDVLQNIEFAIVSVYRRHREMTDHEVLHVLEVLMDAYSGEKIGRPPRASSLSANEREMLANVHSMCEWRLGRAKLSDDPRAADFVDPHPKTVDEILLCLKRIVRSVKRWNKERGRQGYLSFIVNYVR